MTPYDGLSREEMIVADMFADGATFDLFYEGHGGLPVRVRAAPDTDGPREMLMSAKSLLRLIQAGVVELRVSQEFIALRDGHEVQRALEQMDEPLRPTLSVSVQAAGDVLRKVGTTMREFDRQMQAVSAVIGGSR